jgi:hypothetical protein
MCEDSTLFDFLIVRSPAYLPYNTNKVVTHVDHIGPNQISKAQFVNPNMNCCYNIHKSGCNIWFGVLLFYACTTIIYNHKTWVEASTKTLNPITTIKLGICGCRRKHTNPKP